MHPSGNVQSYHSWEHQFHLTQTVCTPAHIEMNYHLPAFHTPQAISFTIPKLHAPDMEPTWLLHDDFQPHGTHLILTYHTYSTKTVHTPLCHKADQTACIFHADNININHDNNHDIHNDNMISTMTTTAISTMTTINNDNTISTMTTQYQQWQQPQYQQWQQPWHNNNNNHINNTAFYCWTSHKTMLHLINLHPNYS